MTTKRIMEAGTLKVDPTTKALRICLISEGQGSSADFPREFFVQDNADRLARSLSFPAHPIDPNHPEHRDPLSAIARVGESVAIEQDPKTGKMGMWSDYKVSSTRPELQTYLEEYGDALGLSVFSDSDGHEGPDGKWVAESLVEDDPYRSVDLVIAAGRGGKFARVAESLGITVDKTSATAEEEEETHMDKDIKDAFDALGSKIESAVGQLTEALKPTPQGSDSEVELDEEAVNKAVEARLATRDKVQEAVNAAKLTESQVKVIMARVDKGATFEDVQPDIERDKAVLVEARKPATKEDEPHYVAEHLGGGDNGGEFELAVPSNFGKVG